MCYPKVLYLTVYFQFNRYFTLIEHEEIYLINQARGPFGESSRSKKNGPSAARSAQKRPRANILPVRSQESLINGDLLQDRNYQESLFSCGIIRVSARSNT